MNRSQRKQQRVFRLPQNQNGPSHGPKGSRHPWESSLPLKRFDVGDAHKAWTPARILFVVASNAHAFADVLSPMLGGESVEHTAQGAHVGDVPQLEPMRIEVNLAQFADESALACFPENWHPDRTVTQHNSLSICQ